MPGWDLLVLEKHHLFMSEVMGSRKRGGWKIQHRCRLNELFGVMEIEQTVGARLIAAMGYSSRSQTFSESPEFPRSQHVLPGALINKSFSGAVKLKTSTFKPTL